MTDNEVNKIIAEFMGWKYIDWDKEPNSHISGSSLFDDGNQIMYRGLYFTGSLDALVPVWEKLRKEYKTEKITTFNLFDYNGKPWNCSFETNHDSLTDICIEHESDNPYESASYATAKAILALKGEQK